MTKVEGEMLRTAYRKGKRDGKKEVFADKELQSLIYGDDWMKFKELELKHLG